MIRSDDRTVLARDVADDEDRHEADGRQDSPPPHLRTLSTATAAASPPTTIEPK